MELKDKKGISGVIVTILIVLVAIIAVGVLWTSIRSYIESGTEAAATQQDCLDVNLKIEKVNVNADNVTISRGTGKDISIDNVSIRAGDETRSIGGLEIMTEETVHFNNSIESGEKVEVAAKIGDIYCDPSDSETA